MRTQLDELAPVDFAIQLLAHQARGRLGPEALGVLPRPTLLRIARTWGSHPGTLAADPSAIRRFSDFQAVAKAWLKDWDTKILRLEQRFRVAVAPILGTQVLSDGIRQQMRAIEVAGRTLRALSQPLTHITDSIAESFTASLPDWGQVQRALREADRGKEHLDEIGYGFVVSDWGIPALREIAKERPTAREVHRAFLAQTRSAEFASALLQRVEGSRTLQRRAPILQPAYNAHCEREYALSVPVFYAQLEGILTDLLVLEGLARRRGHRAHKRTGGELRGLGPKARHYSKGESVMRQFLTQELLEGLVPDRNGVLHGSKTSYRQARRSSHLLLLIDVLTKITVATERGSSRK